MSDGGKKNSPRKYISFAFLLIVLSHKLIRLKKVTVRFSKSIILISCLKISREKSFRARKKLNEIELKWKEKHERRERKKTFTLIERTTTYFRVNFHYFIPQKHDVLKLLKMPCKKAFPPHESICSLSSAHLPYIFFFFIVRKTFQQ